MFIDETGVNQDMTRNYARSLVGDRALSLKPCSKGKRTTLVAGLSKDGIVGSFIFQGYMDNCVFNFYVSEVLLKDIEKGSVIFMDNASVHKSSQLENIISSKGCYLVYLPRYSPEFNPIEMAWSKIKSYVRGKNPRTLQEVEQSLMQAIRTITTQDSINYIKHAGYSIT